MRNLGFLVVWGSLFGIAAMMAVDTIRERRQMRRAPGRGSN